MVLSYLFRIICKSHENKRSNKDFILLTSDSSCIAASVQISSKKFKRILAVAVWTNKHKQFAVRFTRLEQIRNLLIWGDEFWPGKSISCRYDWATVNKRLTSTSSNWTTPPLVTDWSGQKFVSAIPNTTLVARLILSEIWAELKAGVAKLAVISPVWTTDCTSAFKEGRHLTPKEQNSLPQSCLAR